MGLDNKEELFIRYKKLEGLVETSIEGYRKVFLDYEKHIGKINYKDFENLKYDVLDYFTKIMKINNNTTYNNKRKHLNAYFNYLVKNNILQNNPIKILDIKKKRENYEPRPTNSEDLKLLLKTIDLKTFAGFRDYVFIILISDTGIRPKEATRLTVNNLDLENNYITLNEDITKTHKSRILPISKIVSDNIRELIKFNNKYFESDYLFLSEFGNQADTILFQRRLKKYSKKSKVSITPYQLRHFFGTEYLKNTNGNLIYLQKIMGHSDINMTKKYVKVDKEALKLNHRQASPLNAVIERNTRVRKILK